MNLIKVISSVIASGKRIVKFYRMGLKDVQTSVETSSYGVDSNPIKDIVGIYVQTTSRGETYIIGYINKNQKALPGELRNYCTDVNGNEKFYTWLKRDGTYEIGGNADNAVRYSPLNTAIQQQATDINAELVKISAAFALLGITYTVAPISINISAAKINEIKTL